MSVGIVRVVCVYTGRSRLDHERVMTEPMQQALKRSYANGNLQWGKARVVLVLVERTGLSREGANPIEQVRPSADMESA